MPASFDRIARPYRWLEYLSFGPMLERCRFCRIPQLGGARRALVLGDGDGRFLQRLLARNPQVHVDAVDQSTVMLRLLQSRVAAVGAGERVRVHQSDALAFAPDGSYDLVVTHFFLDCFTTEEVQALTENIGPHLAPGALWVVSEFAIPRGLAALPARSIVAALYGAFRLITGLRVDILPDYSSALVRAGFVLEERKTFLAGLLVSDRWTA
jgi:ubiquinone/menaquinone biosynthesis C-methylase UbiE